MMRRCALVGLAIVFWAVGCNGNGMPPLAPTRGTVVLADGTPVTDAFVVFTPDASKGTTGPIATATLDANGRYELRTASQYDGVTVGHHVVTVETNFGVTKPSKQRIPEKYLKRSTTPLRAEILAGQSNSVDFRLQP